MHELRFNFRSVALILRGRLEAEEAHRRAAMLIEDAPRLGFPPRLRGWETHPGGFWPFYFFGHEPVPACFLHPASCPRHSAIGYGLNWGDLVTLSKAVKLARGFWGSDWTRRFRERFRANQNHLSAVEELWWLGMWHSPRRVEQECPLACHSDRTVDWRFECRGVVVNLEVKYRAQDWLRFVDAPGYARLLDGYFESLAEKFPVRRPGQLNVVGMTLLGSLDSALRDATAAFLRNHPTVDAVLFRSIARRSSLECECVSQPGCDVLPGLVRPAEEEDRWRSPFILHPAVSDARDVGLEQASFRPVWGLFHTQGPLWHAHWRRTAANR